MQPMRIRAYLFDGRAVGTNHLFALDSILSSACVKREHPELAYIPIMDDAKIIIPDLPFERRGQGDKWYWSCSFNIIRPIKEYIHYWHRRFDDEFERYIDFKGRRGKISESSGRLKGYRMPLNILLFDYMEWFAFGEIELVKDLLTDIIAIGKKPAQGFGLIDHWEVIPWPDDWSVVGPGGKLMRAVYDLPAGVTGARKAYSSIRPPYWHRNSQAEVWLPC